MFGGEGDDEGTKDEERVSKESGGDSKGNK